MSLMIPNSVHFKKPEPLWSSVFHFLRDAIIRGDLKPGDKLKESVIALRLGISRAPVREALRILEVEHFVVSYPQRGFFVRQLTEKEIEECFFVLKTLLSSATRHLSENLHAENRKKLNQCLKKFKEIRGTTNVKLLTDVSSELHNFVIYSTNNSLLKKIYKSYFLYRMKPYMAAIKMDQQGLTQTIEERIDIVEAILRSDVELSYNLTNKNIDNVCNRVVTALREYQM